MGDVDNPGACLDCPDGWYQNIRGEINCKMCVGGELFEKVTGCSAQTIEFRVIVSQESSIWTMSLK